MPLSVESRRARPRHHAPCKRGCHETRGFGNRIKAKSASTSCLSHTHDRKRRAVRKRHFSVLDLDVASGLIQRNPGKRRAHLKSLESGHHRVILADLQHLASDSSYRPLRVDEEGAILCLIFVRINKYIST